MTMLSRFADGLIGRFEGWRSRERAYRELSALDDRSLADIGLARSEIPYILDQKPETTFALEQIPPTLFVFSEHSNPCIRGRNAPHCDWFLRSDAFRLNSARSAAKPPLPAPLNPPARRNRRVVLAVLTPGLHPAVVAFARGAEERVEFLLRGARLGVEIGGHPA